MGITVTAMDAARPAFGALVEGVDIGAGVAAGTAAEIEDAIHFAKSSAGWSAYINGLQSDFDQFKREVRTACDHVRSMQRAA